MISWKGTLQATGLHAGSSTETEVQAPFVLSWELGLPEAQPEDQKLWAGTRGCNNSAMQLGTMSCSTLKVVSKI